MPDTCAVIGCSVVGKNGVRLYQIPSAPSKCKDSDFVELVNKRNLAWIQALGRRADTCNSKLWKVCGRHFISGMRARHYIDKSQEI